MKATASVFAILVVAVQIISAQPACDPAPGVVSAVSSTIPTAERFPALTGKAVTVTFTTATVLASGQSVTITLPSGYISGTIGATGTNFATITSGTAPQYIVATTAEVGAGAITLTLTGATIGGPMAASATGVTVSTTRDAAACGATVALGGAVSSASSTIATAERFPALTAKAVTVTFTTASRLASGQSVTITLPSGYISGTIGATGTNFATITSGTAPAYIVATTAEVAAGAITLTLTGATIGAPMAASAGGVTVQTATDLAATGATVALGGMVTNVVLSIADRLPGQTGKAVTVTFTTATKLLSGQSVTIRLPSGYISGTIGATGASFATTTSGTAPQYIVATTADVAAGAITLTLTGATIGGPVPAGCNGVWVLTRNDLRSTTIVAPPALGGSVTSVSSTIATAERIPTLTGKAVTVTFTTASILASGQSVTITLPSGYISGSIGATGTNFATGTTGTAPQYIVATTADVAAGAITLTLTGATIGGPMVASATGVQVSSTTDRAGVGASLALGGIVTGAALTIATPERIAGITNRRIIVAFTTATTVPNGGFITITLPSGFVSTLTGGAVTGLTANQALVGSNIVLTANAEIAAGAKTVTICGATLGTTVNNAFGVSVTTNRDYTLTCSATGTVVGTTLGTITAVSMTIPFANRVANQAQSAVFAFTTSMAIPTPSCGGSNTLTMSVPANFFASGTPVATGLAGYTATANLAAGTITLSGTTAIGAGSATVTISGLTLGARTPGSDSAVTVAAPLHATSAGTTSGPISNYEVTSVAVTGTCQSSLNCRTVTIGINAAGVATTIAPGSTLVISGLPFSGTPDAMSFGTGVGTLVTSSAVTGNSVTLTVHASGAPWTLGTTATITLSGLILTGASTSFTPWTVQVGSSTPMWSRTYVATSTGTTTTTSLTLARAVPGTQNSQATVAFSTTNGISTGDVIRVNYPVGFFIATPSDTTCSGTTLRYSSGATLGTCSTMSITGGNPSSGFADFTYSGPGIPAGAHSMILSGTTLSTTQRAASLDFSVVVSSSRCSGAPISTGSISNSNPGGPTAPSSGTTFAQSILAVFACAVMFVLC